MAKQVNRLTAVVVKSVNKPGYYADGDGLYLQVTKAGNKSWVFRFGLEGRKREMGLGAYPGTSLSDARVKLADQRRVLDAGKDPIDEKKRKRAQSIDDSKALKTFKEFAEEYIRDKSVEWSNAKHEKQWGSTLSRFVYGVFGDMPVDMIETRHVLEAIKPIWASKTETATRVRQRIETILDAAKAEGLRKGDNPARWKGHLSHILPKPSKIKKVKHHAALPYQELGDFMGDLYERENVAAKGLAFLILTAARTGEVIGATFDEVDIDNAVWIIPADRMKAGKEHRVPLSPKAVEIVQSMDKRRKNEFIFEGLRGGGLSNMAFLQQLKHMKRDDLTAHGFRSTFRDWAAEQTAYPSDVVEMALAHAIANKTEAAYRRGDLFEKRQRLMNDWANYCDQIYAPVEIVPIRAGN